MTYKTVFDAAHQSTPLFSFPAFGLIFLLVGALVAWKPALLNEMVSENRVWINPRYFGMIFMVFAFFWMLIGYSAIAGQQGQGAAELRDPNLHVVEGTVENFDPMPFGGHKYESFDVAGHHFRYSDFIITAGFHNTASHGGPLKAGLQVRLSYVGNDILRIEVAE